MYRVADLEECNQMTAEGLAIVFSPNLLRAPQENFAMILANMAHAHRLVKTLITHVGVGHFSLRYSSYNSQFHVIFDYGDVEADGDPDYDEEQDGEEEFSRSQDSPTHLEDVPEDDGEEDMPPTIPANHDHSPLDFSFSEHLLAS